MTDIDYRCTDPSYPILENLKKDFLDEAKDENIISHIEESVFMIYSSKSMAETILDQVNLILQSMRSRTVSVAHLDEQSLNLQYLKAVGAVSRTHVQYQEDIRAIRVSWISDPDEVQSNSASPPLYEQLEDPADVVLRLLSSTASQEATSEVRIPRPSKRHKVAGQFLSYHRERRSMSWKDSIGRWARCVSLTPRKTTTKTKYGFHKKPYLSVSQEEDSTAQTQISALFGHVLHKEGKEPLDLETLSGRRIISPVLPHPAAFTKIAEGHPTGVAQTTDIILNFIPDPCHDEYHRGAPEVRLRLPAAMGRAASGFPALEDAKLYCVLPSRATDVLLPTEQVDVRLTQTRQIPLALSEQTSLQSFLAASEVHLAPDRLRTPAQTRLLIPQRAVDGEVASIEEFINLPYTFAGMEVHQVVELEHGRNKIRYSSIDAGHHGGQQQRLSLHLDIPSSQVQALTDHQIKQFFHLTEDVVEGILFSWTEGPKQARQRPLPELELQMEDSRQPSQLEDADNSTGRSFETADESTAPTKPDPIEERKEEWPENLTFREQSAGIEALPSTFTSTVPSAVPDAVPSTRSWWRWTMQFDWGVTEAAIPPEELHANFDTVDDKVGHSDAVPYDNGVDLDNYVQQSTEEHSSEKRAQSARGKAHSTQKKVRPAQDKVAAASSVLPSKSWAETSVLASTAPTDNRAGLDDLVKLTEGHPMQGQVRPTQGQGHSTQGQVHSTQEQVHSTQDEADAISSLLPNELWAEATIQESTASTNTPQTNKTQIRSNESIQPIQKRSHQPRPQAKSQTKSKPPKKPKPPQKPVQKSPPREEARPGDPWAMMRHLRRS